ncbi:hypothetical protein L195_g035464 [Trifolium pratense]|uniref:Uncharacterized protein n=1 Tax=Trifolium pratense TaxID=57577 RepID=A0A2K3LLR6_TRIPR|nr:hypothetical protein L195_g035464 [Trifolium pratense]
MPSAETIFSEFSLLLTEEPPIDEPDTINFVVILGKDKISSRRKSGEDDDDEDALIDLDDQLHFPPEEKQIDISKNIRDRVHLKITLNSVCDSACKALNGKIKDQMVAIPLSPCVYYRLFVHNHHDNRMSIPIYLIPPKFGCVKLNEDRIVINHVTVAAACVGLPDDSIAVDTVLFSRDF